MNCIFKRSKDEDGLPYPLIYTNLLHDAFNATEFYCIVSNLILHRVCMCNVYVLLQQKSQRKSSKSSSSTTSEPPGPTGSEFFSMFAAQYADLDSEHHDDIARLILFYPGPYVPVRNVRRKYPRYSTDFYVSSMIQMTVPKDAQTYIGELRFLPSRVKVFYKCPPKLVHMAAL